MLYVVCKPFQKYGYNLLKGASLNRDELDYTITYNGSRVCNRCSQDAYDYLARNDDGKGRERFRLSHEILDIIKQAIIDYNNQSDEYRLHHHSPAFPIYEYIQEEYGAFVKDDEVLTFEFYEASVEDLKEIKDKALAIVKECELEIID